MRKTKVTIIGALFICLLIVGGTAAMGKHLFLDIARPLGTDPKMYNENPDPVYNGNSNQLTKSSESSLLSKDDILAANEFPEGSKVTRLELVTWGEEEKQQQEARYSIVALERLVWVLEAEIPEYEHARFGTIRDAKVHYVYDAETGDVLNSGFTGTPEEVPLQARER
jgi:hypothetical protein